VRVFFIEILRALLLQTLALCVPQSPPSLPRSLYLLH
jgi:hypothetical protein